LESRKLAAAALAVFWVSATEEVGVRVNHVVLGITPE
jgi:hypothetical protein